MMDFPAYVPAGARKYISKNIEEQLASITALEEKVREIEAVIAEKSERGEIESLDHLRWWKATAIKVREQLAGNVKLLQRVACDERMRDVYAILIRELPDEERQYWFFLAAFGARSDFRKYREKIKQAEELRGKIAATADKLASLIRQVEDLPVLTPRALYDLNDLLKRFGCVNALEDAPSVPKLLGTLAAIAREEKACLCGWQGVAIASQKNNPKTEYLRGVCALLTSCIPIPRIKLTPGIKKAVAGTATVVIDEDVTYDDVRKAADILEDSRRRNG